MPGKVFFDTNVLVHAHDSSSPEKKARSQELLFQSLRDNTGTVSPQVLSEFFVTVTRKIKKPMLVSQARVEVELLSVMATVDLDATLVMRAIDHQVRWQLSYWDALIIAAAERAGCGTLYSEDLSDGQSYCPVTVRNPYK
jgi:predicted nucleic acid-binding protein